MFTGLRTHLKSLSNIIYPRHCTICKSNLATDSLDGLLCRQCWDRIKRNVPPICFRCGRHLEESVINHTCASCRERHYHFDRAYSACTYEGVLKELIHQFKYTGKEYLGNILSRLLIEFINEYGLSLEPFDFVIPIPLHRRKLREREFNQAEILAGALALKFGLVLLKDGLLRLRDTSTQTELPKEERLENVKGCFAANPGVEFKGRNILLVDDLLTTAATCSEAAYVLKNAGCRQVLVLVLAN